MHVKGLKRKRRDFLSINHENSNQENRINAMRECKATMTISRETFVNEEANDHRQEMLSTMLATAKSLESKRNIVANSFEQTMGDEDYNLGPSHCKKGCRSEDLTNAKSLLSHSLNSITIQSKISLNEDKNIVQHNLLNPRNSFGHVSDMSPDEYLQDLLKTMLGFTPTPRPTLEISSIPVLNKITKKDEPYILPITEEELINYDIDVVSAVRDKDLDTLRSLHERGKSLSCCNRYGESLLHMACRRGFTAIFEYLAGTANVAIRITDDCGRTPLHDTLWHKDCQYDIMNWLVCNDPSLLLLCDKRGHTPFAYARREHWDVWKQFLWDRREHIKDAIDRSVMNLFNLSTTNSVPTL